MQGKLSIFIFLLFVGLNREVCAERTCDDSFFCSDKTIEILLIAAVIALCVIVLVQCIVIACLSYKINKIKKSVDKINFSRSSGLYTYHTTNLALEEKEDITYVPNRVRRFTETFPTDAKGRRLTEPSDQSLNRFTIVDGNDAQKEIWGLY